MFIRLLLCLTLALPQMLWAEGKPKAVTSRINAVTIFLNGAQVTRNARSSLISGTQQLRFTDLTAQLDPRSVQVQGEGNFTILSVTSEMKYPEVTVKDLPKTEIEQLQAEEKKVRDQLSLEQAMLNGLNEAFAQEKAIWTNNRQLGNAETPATAESMLAAGQMFLERETDYRKKVWQHNLNIRDFNEEIARLQQRIAELQASAIPVLSTDKASREVIVTVSAKAAVTAYFTMSYLVRNAGWLPAYDLRVKDVNSPLKLSYKAHVYQSSDEDWRNVKLTLSTGNPNQNGQRPNLSPWFLTFNAPRTSSNYGYTSPSATSGTSTFSGSTYNYQAGGLVTGRIFDETGEPLPGATIVGKGSTVGTFTDMDGAFSLNLPPGINVVTVNYVGYDPMEMAIQGTRMSATMSSSNMVLDEVVITGNSVRQNKNRMQKEAKKKAETLTVPLVINQVERATNVEFEIDQAYSIPTTGKHYTVEMVQHDLETVYYDYAVTPKLDLNAYLTARITGWENLNLLEGEANLFFEGTFVGKTLINVRNLTDTMSISLGPDRNVVVSRTKVTDFRKDPALGSKRKETRAWEIEVHNQKKQPIHLIIEDQVPVSQVDDIEVTYLNHEGAKLNPQNGMLEWDLDLKAGENRKLEFSYEVKYPKGQSISLE